MTPNRPPSIAKRVPLIVPCVAFAVGLVLSLAVAFPSRRDARAADRVLVQADASDSLMFHRADPARVMGVSKADCKMCHPSEVAAWMKTVHYLSPDQRLRKVEGNTKRYADALGIARDNLLNDSVCSGCHGTQAEEAGEIRILSGVSCESCHGASGVADGWLEPHRSYHASMEIPRSQETAEHRVQRIERCEKAGMIRSPDTYELAKSCYGCHIVGNEKLVADGHKLASAFEFVSWSTGEVRHNFFVDETKNAEAPTLWAERTDGTVTSRRRVKFIVGSMVQLEMALRHRAVATNPAVIPQLGGLAAAANGKLAQINGLAAIPETQAVAALVGPLLGTLFVPTPNDNDTYTAAADKVAEQARKFAASNDGSDLAELDALIQATPPHYSQQFKDKYLN